MPISSPTDISGCVAWLAADRETASDGDLIATAHNGGSAGDLTASGGARPTYKTGVTPTGKPVFRFDGTANTLSLAATLTLSDMSLFVVVKQTGDGALLGSTNSQPQTRVGQGGSNVLSTYDGGSNPQSSPLATAQGQWTLVEFVRSGNTVSFAQDGTGYGTGTFSAASSGGRDFNRFGSFAGSVNFLNGDVAAVVAYDTAIVTTDRQDVRDYLTARYITAASGVTGTLAATLGAVTASATGTVAVQGTAAVTLGSVGLAAAGTVAVAGQLTATLGAVTVSSAGAIAVAGAAAVTIGSVGLAASGTVAVTGSAAVTLGGVTLTSAGTVTNGPTGTLAVTLGPVTVAAAGAVAVTGQLAATLGAVTLASAGHGPVTLGAPGGTFRRPAWSWPRRFARAGWSWPRTWRYTVATRLPPQTLTKAVSDDRDFLFDFSTAPECAGPGGATVASALIEGGTGLTIGAPAPTTGVADGIPAGKAVQVEIGGGSPGTYPLACVATLTTGRVLTVPALLVVAADHD